MTALIPSTGATTSTHRLNDVGFGGELVHKVFRDTGVRETDRTRPLRFKEDIGSHSALALSGIFDEAVAQPD